LEGSTSEKTPVATVSTISRTKNEPPIQVVALKQKAIPLFSLYSLDSFSNSGIEFYYKHKLPFNF
jgi:hypothetical protein